MNGVEQIDSRTFPPRSIHQSEREFFDRKAGKDWEDIEKGGGLIDPARHQATLKLWGLDRDLSGKRILDCGCGAGFLSVLLAKLGAEVSCFDLAPKNIDIVAKKACLNGVSDKVKAEVAAFEDLRYDDEWFDLIVGKNILHHIADIEESGRQIRRLLKKGGKAIFYELSAKNPILMFFRKYVIGRSRLIPKLGTPDEHPLTKDELETLSAIFEHRCKISYPKFRFFGKLDRQVFQQRYRTISWILEGMDKMIYTLLPPLRKYSYKILLEFTK